MDKVKCLLAALVPVVVTASALVAAATAPAAVIANEHDETIGSDISACGPTAEVIAFRGKAHHVFRVTKTQSGALHVADEVNLQSTRDRPDNGRGLHRA